jgi:predicted amidohydrolase YtcJ
MTRRYDRRDFMGLSGAGMAGLLATPLPTAPLSVSRALAAVDQDPDVVVTNAKVYTVDPAMPRAEAFAVKAGRFVAVGSTEEVKALIGKRTRTVDAKQMTVVPGFVDAHNHAPGAILLYEVLVGNPYEVEFVTIDSIVEKLRARARETPPGFWVEGFFFDDTKVKDKRPLDVRDLDRVSTEHPVSVRHRGGHTTFYNSKAFALAASPGTRQARRPARSTATPRASSMGA